MTFLFSEVGYSETISNKYTTERVDGQADWKMNTTPE
jgi:hypothetical protein